MARGLPPARQAPGPRRARARPAAQLPAARGLVDVPERPAAAVRRPPRPAGGQLRRRPRRVGRAVRRARGRRRDLPDRVARVPGLRAVLPLHRQCAARRRVDRAGPRASAPPDRSVRPGRRERDRGRRRLGAHARRPLLRLAAARPRLPRAVARAPRRRLFRGPCAGRLAHADGGWGLASGLHERDEPARPDVRVRRARRCDVRQRSRRSATPGWTPRSTGRVRAAAEDAPAAWAAVDRRVVDLAPAVPYVNDPPHGLRVEAGRQRHATTRRTDLLDQIWVR